MGTVHLQGLINTPRVSDLRLSWPGGETLQLDPTVRAIEQVDIGLLLVWPVNGDVLKAKRIRMIWPETLCSAEPIQ